MTTEKKYIGLWLDETSDSANPRWIVSRDTDDSTNTVATFAPDDYADAEELAKDECRRTGCPVLKIDSFGYEEVIYEIDRPIDA